MADSLTNKSVRRGYAVLRRKESEVTMALEVCDNEINPTVECIKLSSNPETDSNREALDQVLKLEDTLGLLKLDADLLQTKRLTKRKPKAWKVKSKNSYPSPPATPPAIPQSPLSEEEAHFVG